MADQAYNPDPTKTPPNPDLISPFRQQLSSSLIEASFGILGNTFAQDTGMPQSAEPYKKLGADIGSALRDRWHKQEYENFQSQYINQYQQAANAVSGNLQMQMAALDRGEMLQPDGSITKIDTKSEGFLRTKDTVIRQTTQAIHKINDQFLQDAAKYANNPYISGVAQNLMQGTTNIVSEATGPTQAGETEQGYADIEQTRAQTRYYNRLPAEGGGSGSEKMNQRGDPRMLLRELGLEGFIERLVGTPEGREWTEPYQQVAAAQIETELLKSDPDLEFNPDMLKVRMGEKEDAIQKRAAGLYMQTTFPREARELEAAGARFADLFEQEQKEQALEPIIKGRLTATQTTKALKPIRAAAMAQLENLIVTGEPRTIEEAIGTIVKEWLPQYLKEITGGNKATQQFQKKAVDDIITYLQENWEDIDIAYEAFKGRPKPGILERIREEATKAPEAQMQRPEYSGKGGLGGKAGAGTGKGLYKNR